MSQFYYLIRSKLDGKYLAAQIPNQENETGTSYLLLFREDFEALSYLNSHASELASRFSVESIATNQLKSLLQRWGFHGVGLVEDPLLPRIQFSSF
jgi:hypothetical protein